MPSSAWPLTQCIRLMITSTVLLFVSCTAHHSVNSATPVASTATPTVSSTAAASESPITNAAEALQALLAGNQRYVVIHPAYPHQSAARRTQAAQGQKPFAIVLGCADSRVTPEIIFDQGIGDIFDVRVAGNVLDHAVIGSLEFAVAEFGSPLIVVLGHERCGAVKATLEHLEHQEERLPGDIPLLVKAVTPAVKHVKGLSGDLLDNGVRENVKLVVDKLKHDSVLTKAVQSGQLKIVGARYDLDTGAVELIAP